MRVRVDLDIIAPSHAGIDARLRNWAMRSHGQWRPQQSLGFRHQSECHTGTSGHDKEDAHRVAIALSFLPEKHRRALEWSYCNARNPARIASDLGVSLAGLADLIREGRQMLANREMRK